jgi:signal transduction histidine kinase
VRKRILVVDGSRTQRERLRMLLDRADYEVQTASDGEEALALVAQSPPDLIVSGVNMPGIDGVELCQAIRSGPRTQRVPFILMTEWAAPADLVKGLEAGADKQQIIELLFSTFEELGRVNGELRQTAADAERANLAKSQFLSRMSHELRTPLNAILGFSQLLEMDQLTPEQLDGVRQIRKGGKHLLDLINEVLDISRIEAGGLSLSLEPVPVAKTLTEAVELIRPLADQRGISIEAPAEVADDRRVRADRQRLSQVLLNLLSNAVKYNREAGTVTASWHETGRSGRIRIAVGDTGLGIPPEAMERLFAPFDRLGAEQSGEEGTGLGLALTKTLVEAMGGTIGVDSTVGVGSTFWVELELATDQAAETEPPREGLTDQAV